MIPLPLAWTLLMVSLWTSGSSQILLQETVNVLYPKLLSNETIECNCADTTCDSVYWFRTISNYSKVQFLGKCNNAGRFVHGDGVKAERFKFSRRNSVSFALRIISVTEEDTGIYSCVLKDRKSMDTWKPGTLLQPGVIPPTSPPKTKRKPPIKSIKSIKSVCHCKKNPFQNGCGSFILWPLVGLIVALALSLICILYYFSRLPKKCRHRFVKRR